MKKPAKKAKTKRKPSIPKSAIRNPKSKSLLTELADLRLRLREAEETLTAIRKGEVDAVVVSGPQGEKVYTLKGAEQPYRILVESMNEGALSLTSTGAIINCNKAFANIAGTPCGTLIGRSFRDMISKKESEKFEAFWKQAVEEEARTEIELNFSGRTVPTYLSVNARTYDGECWVFAVVTDISERKRTEAQLAEYRLHLERLVDEKTQQLQAANEELQTANEELLTTNEELAARTAEFEAIINSMSDAVIYTDTKHEILLANPAVTSVFGYSLDELEGKTLGVLYADEGDFKRMQRERYNLAMKNHQPVYELQCRRKNGTTFLCDTRTAPVRHSNGAVIGLISIYRDITERKKMEEALRASNERFRLVLDNSRDVIYRLNVQTGYYDYISPSAERIVGFSADELMAQDAEMALAMIHPSDLPSVRAAHARIEETGEGDLEYRQRTKSGDYRWILNHSSLSRDSDGRPLYRSGNLSDITERKKAEDNILKLNKELHQHILQLQDANKEIESFSYSVSHDLRAPLRIIAGFSEAIQTDEASRLSDASKDYFRRVRAAVEKMGQLIDALLSLSQSTRGALKRTRTDLSAAARAVIEGLRRGYPERQVECVVTDNITAEGDAAMLRAVITNLLQNAWKFTMKREHAKIEFGAFECGVPNSEFGIETQERCEHGKTVYFVRDNGAGFDMTYANRLFMAFQRLHTLEEFPGLGIGLATVQRIIHRHGGRVWAEGEPGKGATFFFTLG